MRLTTLTLLAVLLTHSALAAPTIGTMSGEIRSPDGRIHVQRTIDALTRLGVNTYYYLIYGDEHDWDDFPAFLDAANEQHIQVFAYVMPWSETPPKKLNGFSEPFRNDYVAWATEVAKLSLNHPNLAGYVIDDFYDNTEPGHFTPTYVHEMVDAGRQVNPKIKFYPLMYFQTPWAQFTYRFGQTIDGVVICYPKSEAGLRNAVTYLQDHRHGPSAMITLPRHHGAERGDGASVVADVDIDDPDNAELSFYYDVTDQVEGDTSLQIAEVRADGRAIWHSPTEARMRDGIIDLDLYKYVSHRGRVRLSFDVITVRSGVPEVLPIVVRFDDIRVYGSGKNNPHFADLVLKGAPSGKFELQTIPGSIKSGQFNIPIVLMPAGEGQQFEKRYDAVGTPQSVAEKVRLSLDLVKAGLADGVVPYRTPLDPADPMYQAIRGEFYNFMKTQNTTETSDTSGHD